jgi:hypothetical protein
LALSFTIRVDDLYRHHADDLHLSLIPGWMSFQGRQKIELTCLDVKPLRTAPNFGILQDANCLHHRFSLAQLESSNADSAIVGVSEQDGASIIFPRHAVQFSPLATGSPATRLCGRRHDEKWFDRHARLAIRGLF